MRHPISAVRSGERVCARYVECLFCYYLCECLYGRERLFKVVGSESEEEFVFCALRGFFVFGIGVCKVMRFQICVICFTPICLCLSCNVHMRVLLFIGRSCVIVIVTLCALCFRLCVSASF